MATYEELMKSGAKPVSSGITYEDLVKRGATPQPESRQSNADIVEKARAQHISRQNPAEYGPNLSEGKTPDEQKASALANKGIEQAGQLAGIGTLLMPTSSIPALMAQAALAGGVEGGTRQLQPGESRLGNATQDALIGGGLGGLLGGAGRLASKAAPIKSALTDINQHMGDVGNTAREKISNALDAMGENVITPLRNKANEVGKGIQILINPERLKGASPGMDQYAASLEKRAIPQPTGKPLNNTKDYLNSEIQETAKLYPKTVTKLPSTNSSNIVISDNRGLPLRNKVSTDASIPEQEMVGGSDTINEQRQMGLPMPDRREEVSPGVERIEVNRKGNRIAPGVTDNQEAFIVPGVSNKAQVQTSLPLTNASYEGINSPQAPSISTQSQPGFNYTSTHIGEEPIVIPEQHSNVQTQESLNIPNGELGPNTRVELRGDKALRARRQLDERAIWNAKRSGKTLDPESAAKNAAAEKASNYLRGKIAEASPEIATLNEQMQEHLNHQDRVRATAGAAPIEFLRGENNVSSSASDLDKLQKLSGQDLRGYGKNLNTADAIRLNTLSDKINPVKLAERGAVETGAAANKIRSLADLIGGPNASSRAILAAPTALRYYLNSKKEEPR